LLRDVHPDHFEAFVAEQISQREIFYMKAIHVIDGPGIHPDSVIRLIGQLPPKG